MNQQTKLQDLVITRVFDYPVELVWNAWTDPRLVMLWWGPADYTSPFCELDFREGGKYLFCMRAPAEQGGQDFYSTGVYEKIVSLERLEFTQYLSDKDGNIVEPAQVGMPEDFPYEVKFEIQFVAQVEQTKLIITERNWTTGQMSKYAVIGMNQSLDKLAASLNTPNR
jgi:uncharacterized protein YndB with AHSA1/START domain